jgi:hypothetical protein
MKKPTTTTTTTRLRVWVGIALAVSGVLASAPMAQAAGPPAPGLGVAGSFAVLAGDGILMNGPTMITGDIGSFPAPTIGFGSLTLNGINHGADAVTQGAKTDLTAAYTAAAASGPTIPVVGDLGGQTLTPGVYNSASSLALTGTLTLAGTSSDVWIFQAGSTLTTASLSSVAFAGGATPCNVFWQVGGSATIGAGSAFKGTIVALTSITLATGASIDGRVLARDGAVTLDTNTITNSCSAAAPASATPAAPAASQVPNTAYAPDSSNAGLMTTLFALFLLLCLGGLGVVDAIMIRRRS